jgi:sugar diacid utilization regulator
MGRLPKIGRMLRLADLLASPALGELEVVVPGDPQRPVHGVALAEDAQRLEQLEANAFCVLSRVCSEALSGYRLDTAVRLAASRDATALALASGDGTYPATAVKIAERSGLGLLRVPLRLNLGALCTLVGRELDGGAAAALERVRRFSELLDVDGDEDPVQRVAELAARVLGIAVEVTSGRAHDDRIEVEVLQGGTSLAVLSATAGGGAVDAAVAAALRLGATEAGRALDERARRGEAPVRSRGLLLTELLLAPAQRSEPLTHRARTLGMPIDGWHVVSRLESSALEERSGQDELAELELADQIARVALQTARTSGGAWHIATTETAHLLVNMRQSRPDHRAAAEAVATARRIVARLAERFPSLTSRIGIGGAHAGVSGLRTSAIEARAALAATSAADVVAFDAAGLRHLLVEWYTSDTVRDSVHELLAPLDRLGQRRSQTAIETLRAYLDHQGSLSKTAQALHLHRNAVAYRIKRIFDLLELDPQDPDQRLALHLACRARELA